jgi:hypothetical protein
MTARLRDADPGLALALSRRKFLLHSGGGFGALAAAYVLSQGKTLAAENIRAAEERHARIAAGVASLAPKQPHYLGKAKSVIFLFMDGGPSHIDLFDPKPKVNELAGQPLPDSVNVPLTASGTAHNPLLPTQRVFKRHGESGIPVSDWLPHIAECVDDLAVLRSCCAEGLSHDVAICQMNTGSLLAGRPSLGSWVTYGLGVENQDLPAFVVLLDDREPDNGPRNWSTAFLPPTFQGTRFRGGSSPISNLRPPPEVGFTQQRSKLDFLKQLNRQHAKREHDVSGLEARIASYELAFRMQASAPEAVDLSRETAKTRELYGLDAKETEKIGRNCLLARRLVERGVRFVQLYCGSGRQWDAHTKIEENHRKMCRASDQPVAALLKDLKQRGLLDQTLVVWGGEFGRTPMSETGNGRDHNPTGFTMWMAGGGVRGGQIIGATDEFGLRAVENRIHIHDLHATILHLMGLNHLDLTFLHNGREERATVDAGRVVEQVAG